ncbi:MAG: FAD-dependent oxidoreductase, partial [Flavobacteriales bacterium]|nr:FAD-dependent oxidoreductase [Flavobacteriales bacterium]
MSDTSTGKVPSHAQVVIIGGGIIGTNIAYHLTKRGYTDVVLLEKHKLTSGTTWHAAGLVTSGFMTETGAKMAKYTRELYRDIEKETGQATGFKESGMIQIAVNEHYATDLRRKATFNRLIGIEAEELSPKEVQDMWPMANVDDIVGGFFTEGARINPVDVTMAITKGAKAGGATILEDVTVTGINVKNKRIESVETDQGTITCEVAVNCAGMWARQIGEMAGCITPLQAIEHYYAIMESDEMKIDPNLPILKDPSKWSYYREEVGDLMVGFFEEISAPWSLDKVNNNFVFGEIEPDMDRMLPYLMSALERLPIAAEANLKLMFCGPESFTPDISPLFGEYPEVENFFVVAGLNSLGILMGGGMGSAMANLIVDGLPDIDITGMNIDRFHRVHQNKKYRKDRSVEVIGEMYKIHFPNKPMETAREMKKHVLYDRLKANGAVFIQSAGWEVPCWYAPEGVEKQVEWTYKRQSSFEHVAAEHYACRNNVIMMEMSFMSKILVQGKDALKNLNYVCCNDIDVENGKIVYTQWTNENG